MIVGFSLLRLDLRGLSRRRDASSGSLTLRHACVPEQRVPDVAEPQTHQLRTLPLRIRLHLVKTDESMRCRLRALYKWQARLLFQQGESDMILHRRLKSLDLSRVASVVS